jgi:DUF971 family protein
MSRKPTSIIFSFFDPNLVNLVNPVQNAFRCLKMNLQPQRVEVIGHELALVWSDGMESYIDLEKLRRACPCAACGGEPDVMGEIQRPRVSYGSHSFELRGFRLVGGYALQPTWNDGHDTGLYTFRQLRALNENAAT